MHIDTHTYKETLEKMRTEVEHELSTLGVHTPENARDWIATPTALDTEEPDQNVAADRTEEWNERNALVAVLEFQYNHILDALTRIAENTYGTCTICGVDIEVARLAIEPTAHTCIEHKDEDS